MVRSAGEIPVPFAKELNDLLKRLVAAAKDAGREEAIAQMRAVVDGASGRRGPGRPRGSKNKPRPASKPGRTKSGKKRKNPWASMTPTERLARVNAIRKGRGLPPREK